MKSQRIAVTPPLTDERYHGKLRKRFRMVLLLSVLCFGNFLWAQPDSATEIETVYKAVQKNIWFTFETMAKNPSNQNVVKVLWNNDAACKNILKLSECPEDFTAAMIQSLDEFRSVAAIMFLKSVQGLEYTDEETKRIKAWFKLCEQTDGIARKYGFEPLSLLSAPKEPDEKEKQEKHEQKELEKLKMKLRALEEQLKGV